QRVSAGAEWVEWFLPFQLAESYGVGQLGVKFGFGASERPEIFEIGGIEVIHYGKSRTLEEMPRTSFRYDGREPDAPWRAEAAARIEKYRKADYTIRVVNPDGIPVPGASVHVRLKRHAFHFGTAFPARLVLENETFRNKLLELFNAGSTENDLKWPPWEGDWGASWSHETTLAALQLLKEHGFHLRGHVLVWPSERNLPNSIKARLPARDPAIPGMVLDHIEDIVTATRDYLDEWDVLNEPYDNNDLMEIFGDAIMIDWFKAARQHHPTAKLFINDYAIIAAGGVNFAHQDFYEQTIRYLVDNGAPIDGIGFQGHFAGSPTGINRAWSILNRFADAFPGLDLRITEFDVDTDDEQLQADYTRDFLTLVFSHPRVVGLQVWGFWEGAHWRPRAAMYRENWEEKPNGAAFRQLVHETWTTDETRQSARDGRVRGRAFKGLYEVTVSVDGQSVNAEMEIGDDGNSLDVVVPVTASGEPAILHQPLGAVVSPGEPVHITLEAAGHPAPTIQWFKDGQPLDIAGPTLDLAAATPSDEGTYHAVVTNAAGSVTSRSFRIGVRPPGQRHERFANISTRGKVLTGSDVMIAGFVITGAENKHLLIRGVGPTLAAWGVPGTLADPVLDVQAEGAAAPLASNDDWDPALAAAIESLGAFPFEADTRSAALALDLAPRAYTARFAGKAGTTGVGLIEVYDATTGQPAELANISTRGYVGTGDDILVAGFVVTGEVPARVLIRGIGPGLNQFGVPGTLADPVIRLFESLPGGDQREIAANDDWMLGTDVDAIEAATAAVGAFELPAYSHDAGLLLALEPGSYTVHLAGRENGTGTALAEIYRLP
ncbi:MAG: hypothetical protein D6781_07540, partial [Verrucomicrobia bacterium]